MSQKYNGAPCAYFDGVYNYFNINANAYHRAFPSQIWNGPCVILWIFRHKISHIRWIWTVLLHPICIC